MKKIISYLLISIFCFNIFWINSIFSYDEKTSYLKEIEEKKWELSKSKQWKKYIKAIDAFIETNKDDEKKLLGINSRLKDVIYSNSLKNNNLWNTIKYLNAKVNVAILNLNNWKVKKWDFISVHYIGTFENGEKFDSTYDRKMPIDFQVWVWQMISWFDNAFIGMKVWEKKSITLQPNEAYGQRSDNYNKVIEKTQLQDFLDAWYKLEAGEILSTEIWNITILSADEKTITLDANHPMAWKILKFDIKLLNIKKNKYDKLSIKVITDSRNSSTDANVIIDEMKLLPSISGAKIEVQDFADKGVKEYLLENEIKALPAFVFSTNNFDVTMDPVQAGQPKINSFLTKLKSGEFFLEIGATYNPFVERSERWFRIVTSEQLDTLKKDVYVKWNENAKIMWFEYSELECPYCARHFKSNTSKEVLEKYPNDINLVFQHYPLPFHNNAEVAAQALECMWAQKGTKGFYELIEKSFTDAEVQADGNIKTNLTSSRTYLVEQAVAFGADKAKMEKCIDDKVFATKVANQMRNATDFFGVTWTPGNVLINTETLEFEIISGAYPVKYFIELLENIK